MLYIQIFVSVHRYDLPQLTDLFIYFYNILYTHLFLVILFATIQHYLI